VNPITLETRRDDFSYQVYSEDDARFWFRLVREPGCDVVTDFFLGEQPREHAGRLLVACFRRLGLAPRSPLQFRDLISSEKPDFEALRRAEQLHAAAGRYLLAEFGIDAAIERVENLAGKRCLTLSARD